MHTNSLETIFKALNDGQVRYLVVGGLAVVAHGFVRFTADLDLVLDFEKENLKKAVAVFESLGYSPRPPVPFAHFIEATHRKSWIRDKGLTVFSLFSGTFPDTEVDLFVEEPFDFKNAYRGAVQFEVKAGISATTVGYSDLLHLKRQAGRPQDLEDIHNLEAIRVNDHE